MDTSHERSQATFIKKTHTCILFIAMTLICVEFHVYEMVMQEAKQNTTISSKFESDTFLPIVINLYLLNGLTYVFLLLLCLYASYYKENISIYDYICDNHEQKFLALFLIKITLSIFLYWSLKYSFFSLIGSFYILANICIH